ncbi:hypothetical protein EUX98_g3757 [Antrodiella citrinella]|uniref:Rab-GAP TBC domain-containing protein n=1 Tax=Antrodiella citrinella TaxID=2447956 RepID=A0A4V3XIT5_9APHY|nr:hypothetical protein EUX98_g3757 [Antrodiella citrinella]
MATTVALSHPPSATSGDEVSHQLEAVEEHTGNVFTEKVAETGPDGAVATTKTEVETEVETQPTIPGEADKTDRLAHSRPSPLDVSHDDDISPSAPTAKPAPLTITQSDVVASPLDALLSPSSPDAHFEARQSVAASDITDDDGRFSTVLLSARQSLDPDNLSLNGSIDPSSSSTLAEDEPEHDGKRNTLSTLEGSELIRMVHMNRQHKKTASTSTIVSASNVPFLLARLDVQNDEEEGGGKRRSLDGQQKLQEDFNRMHQEIEPQENSRPVENIDWDFWGDVVSDYAKFAAERPEELAKAIERGIPKTLRGMIWQLM